MTLQDVLLLSAQILILLIAALFLGRVAKLSGLPKVAGELAAGILLGPTFAGHVWPGSADFFNPANVSLISIRESITHCALLFFLAAAGMELHLENLQKNLKTIAICSLSGIVIPFILGCALVLLFPLLFSDAPEPDARMVFFMGTALSISALPVIAKILIDLRIMKTLFGTLVMSSAAIDDLVGWVLFSVLLFSFQSGHISPDSFGVFGAFMLGILLSGAAHHRPALYSKFLFLVSKIFAPLFFASVGLKFNFIAHFDIKLTILVFAAACLGKIAGVSIGGRLSGLHRRESWALAFAMNARGAMGIVLASTALKYGMIGENLFTALVFMALATSIMSGPALKILLRR